MNNDFYNLSAISLRGEEISMSQYKGKVVLIINTASKCWLTYQYKGLEALYQKYKDQGLVVLGFPCNQFGNQEPGGKKEISEGCLINYGVSFPIFSKIEVNGKNTHPIFTYLKSHIFNLFGQKIKWNFTKFIIDKQWNVVKRIAPITKPEKLEKIIISLL